MFSLKIVLCVCTVFVIGMEATLNQELKPTPGMKYTTRLISKCVKTHQIVVADAVVLH